MIRKQHPARMTVHNRNLRSIDSTDVGGGGGCGDKCENPRRGRQKSGSKRSSVGARMSKGSITESSDLRTKNSTSFGPPIPDDILDDLCFRFLINIPDDQKNAPVRLCFQIELAHWFYIDFYCKGNNANVKCPEVSLRDLVGQIFNHCDFLIQYTDSVDKVMAEWRIYKSGVPTYGAALLDNSLNYVLLVQGYFAKNSWGFPKGKVNEDEEAMACASREVMEEVGFDISDKICKTRLIQCFVNDTLIRLYIIRDVPIDFPFAPNTRNEIGKIQWFCIWDLPKDRNDFIACERIGMSPSNFYTVIPFVKELQSYVSKHHNTHNKPRHKPMDAINISTRSSSAFSPVQPQQKNEMLAPALSPLFNMKTPTHMNRSMVSRHSSQHASPNSAFFKPLTSSAQHISYTGTAFVQMLSRASCTSIEVTNYAKSPERVKMKEVTRPVPTVPKAAMPILGRPVYDAFRDEAEKKVVTSLQESSDKTFLSDILCHGITETNEVINYPTDNSEKKSVGYDSCCNLPVKNNISPLPLNPGEDLMKNYLKGVGGCLKNSRVLMTSRVTEDRPLINLCKAWKDFKFDVSRLF
ncbi:mRNA-decapping enzyme 2 [Loa loa]|uniref:mRNA-decapping enzyme 2 n=1 Tax=Loa loa TaxID=7209 RepID=A0A1S0UF55_LOALO|nr:mRNA-decapping enzyme 2 [Loa loa]EJD74183.1 mRNA-decapping enzyme 2 [Loa loa]